MNSKLFGTLALSAAASLFLTGNAHSEKKAKETKTKKEPTAEGWCKSNSCGGNVKDKDGNAAKNSCGGQMACKGITKELCEKDGQGTWTTEAKPSK